jgi:hypothetical protein
MMPKPEKRQQRPIVLLVLLAGLAALAACDGGTTPARDSAAERVAKGLEHVVGRPIRDVSCRRHARGRYRCTFTGEHGCEVVDPIVRSARVTGLNDGAAAEAAVCEAGYLTATPTEARPVEVANALHRAIEEGRWATAFDPSMRRVSCVRERLRHVTAQYRCAARASPSGPHHIAFVQSDGDRIIAMWPLP